jgi:glycosyltransferase involved in cell wall biosynthesis
MRSEPEQPTDVPSSRDNDVARDRAISRHPDISVVIPTRDRPALLREAIDSVRAQRDVDWECIVVDDAGTGDLLTIADPRVRVLRHERPAGPAGARNTGVQAARGRFVFFLDDDDRIAAGGLSALLSEANDGAMTFGQWGFMGSDHLEKPHAFQGWYPGVLVDDPPPLWTGLYPLDSCEEFDASFRTGEDIEFLYRMSFTHRVKSVQRRCYDFRKHPTPRTGIQRRTRLENRLRLISKHHGWYRRHPSSYARQLARAAASAYLADEYAVCARLAMRSLTKRPTTMAVKLLAKSLVELRPATSAGADRGPSKEHAGRGSR